MKTIISLKKTIRILVCMALCLATFLSLGVSASAENFSPKIITINWEDMDYDNAEPNTVYIILNTPYASDDDSAYISDDSSYSSNGNPMQPNSAAVPTNNWDFGTLGTCTVNGSATGGSYWYSSYLYTGADTYTLNLTNKRSDYNLRIELFQLDGGFLWFDKMFFDYTIDQNASID